MDKAIFQFNLIGFCEYIHTKQRRTINRYSSRKNPLRNRKKKLMKAKRVKGNLKLGKRLQKGYEHRPYSKKALKLKESLKKTTFDSKTKNEKEALLMRKEGQPGKTNRK
jgi:hypothetical protein